MFLSESGANRQQQQQQVQQVTSLDILGALPSLFIKQKYHLAELFAGCEMENEYHVYATDDKGDKFGKHILKCVEKSNCFERNCLTPSCRAFEMEVVVAHQERLFYDGPPFLRLIRPYSCTILCLNRPIIQIMNLTTPQPEQIGYIEDIYTMCNPTLNIYSTLNGQKLLKYTLTASCFQWGILCPSLCCDPCQEAFFTLKDTTGNVVSTLEKRNPGCFKACYTNADDFSLVFPAGISTEDKALLLAAALFVDYRYFENPQKENAIM